MSENYYGINMINYHSEWIDVYLRGGEVQNLDVLVGIMQVEKHMGREYLEKLIRTRKSPRRVWKHADRILACTNWGEDRRRKVLEWLALRRICLSHVGNFLRYNKRLPVAAILKIAVENQTEIGLARLQEEANRRQGANLEHA